MPRVAVNPDKQVVPSASMSLREVIDRFSRKLPVNVTQRNPVYLDTDVDYEKAGNQDRTDLAFEASEAKERAIQAKEAARRAVKEAREADRANRAAQAEELKAAKAAAGIGHLDDTMPDDTPRRRGVRKGGVEDV